MHTESGTPKSKCPLFMQVFPSQVHKISRKSQKIRHNFLETQPFWETGSILESLHHALPMKTKILNFDWVGGRGCGKNCFGAMIYVWDRPGHPLSQISKIFFCSPSSYMISQPPPKNKVIWWRSGLGVNTTTSFECMCAIGAFYFCLIYSVPLQCYGVTRTYVCVCMCVCMCVCVCVCV